MLVNTLDLYREQLPFVNRPHEAMQLIQGYRGLGYFLFGSNMQVSLSEQVMRAEVLVVSDYPPFSPAVLVSKDKYGETIYGTDGCPIYTVNTSTDTFIFDQVIEHLIEHAPAQQDPQIFFDLDDSNKGDMLFTQTAMVAADLSQVTRSMARHPKTDLDVRAMDNTEKLTMALTLSLGMMPEELANEIKKIITPENIAIMLGTLVLWAAAHLVGIGQIFDLIMLVTGAIFCSWSMVVAVWESSEHLMNFASYTLNATTHEQLEQGAHEFAQAVIKLGTTVISAILFKKSLKSLAKNPTINNSRRVGRRRRRPLKRASVVKARRQKARRKMTNAEKEMIGDQAARDVLINRLGYKELPARLPSNHGFDGVFRYPKTGDIKDIIIVESKYSTQGRIRLSKTVNYGRQLSPEWIHGTLERMLRAEDDAIRQTARLIRRHLLENKVRTKLNVVDGNGTNRWVDKHSYIVKPKGG